MIGVSPHGRDVSVLYLPLCNVDLLANWAVSVLDPKSHWKTLAFLSYTQSQVSPVFPREPTPKTECNLLDAY